MPKHKKFSTANHPVEMALPMLHFLSAGFKIDLITPTGAPIAIEIWAMPDKDPHVAGFFHASETAFNKSQKPCRILKHCHDPRSFLTCPIYSRRVGRDAQAIR